MTLVIILTIILAVMWLYIYRCSINSRRLDSEELMRLEEEQREALAEEIERLRQVDLEIEELWEDEND